MMHYRLWRTAIIILQFVANAFKVAIRSNEPFPVLRVFDLVHWRVISFVANMKSLVVTASAKSISFIICSKNDKILYIRGLRFPETLFPVFLWLGDWLTNRDVSNSKHILRIAFPKRLLLTQPRISMHLILFLFQRKQWKRNKKHLIRNEVR